MGPHQMACRSRVNLDVDTISGGSHAEKCCRLLCCRRSWRGCCSRSPSSTEPPGVVCTQEFRPGVAVTVKDSVSNVGAASGASLVVREGLFKGSVGFAAARPDLDNYPLAAAGERAGTYQLRVSKPGYAPWVQNNVRVTKGACHVITVQLTALLQPAK